MQIFSTMFGWCIFKWFTDFICFCLLRTQLTCIVLLCISPKRSVPKLRALTVDRAGRRRVPAPSAGVLPEPRQDGARCLLQVRLAALRERHHQRRRLVSAYWCVSLLLFLITSSYFINCAGYFNQKNMQSPRKTDSLHITHVRDHLLWGINRVIKKKEKICAWFFLVTS